MLKKSLGISHSMRIENSESTMLPEFIQILKKRKLFR